MIKWNVDNANRKTNVVQTVERKLIFKKMQHTIIFISRL